MKKPRCFREKSYKKFLRERKDSKEEKKNSRKSKDSFTKTSQNKKSGKQNGEIPLGKMTKKATINV